MIERKIKENKCWVTLKLPVGDFEKAAVIGDWNNWQPEEMKKRKGGYFSITKQFKTGEEHQFRYLINNTEYINDSEADGYIPNEFGTENSVVKC